MAAPTTSSSGNDAQQQQQQQQQQQKQRQQDVAPQEEEYQLTDEELDDMISSALDCPCVQDLREGPCGEAFVAAFTCFHKSKEAPKGSECVAMNLAFTDCLRAHPEALESLQAAEEDGGLFVPEGPPQTHYDYVPRQST